MLRTQAHAASSALLGAACTPHVQLRASWRGGGDDLDSASAFAIRKSSSEARR